jgi:hypothetical protein
MHDPALGGYIRQIYSNVKSQAVASNIRGTWGLMQVVSFLSKEIKEEPTHLMKISRPLGATQFRFFITYH